MSLIVETGTGAIDSESYISVADSIIYHNNRGNATWSTITTAQQEQALRRATDYIEQVYRLKWQGRRVTELQALSFPRYEVLRADGYYYYDYDIVPNEVKSACAEMALKAAQGELAPDLTQGVVREKVDVLEIEYDKYSPQFARYRAIDNLLAPLLTMGSSGTFKTVVRT